MYAFDYQHPSDEKAAVAAFQGDARYLAGGQSLVQAMRLRLASSERLVDLGAIPALKGIHAGSGTVTIGAMTPHAAVARSPEVRQAIPALAQLAGWIGDPSVRNMGTLGGSIANADPAADYPAALLALGATVQTDRRTIPAEQFFTGLYETALQAGELVTAVSFPVPQAAGYEKYRNPASRFALVGVFVAKTAAGVRVAVTGAKSHVFRSPELEAALAASFTPEAAKAVRLSAAGMNADLHASSDYRAAMVSVMASRAVAAALAR
jgi:carbon-monoxide dehydrogenase medium subunit